MSGLREAEGRSAVRILAIYHERDDESGARWMQIDVSSERGYWKLSNLLRSPDLEEVRIVGETESSLGVARTIVLAGRLRGRVGERTRRLRARGDEAYPRRHPFIFINPRPDPTSFD